MSSKLTYRSYTIPYLHNEAAVQRVLIYTHRCADKENGKENVRQCSINKQLFQTTSALLYKQCILFSLHRLIMQCYNDYEYSQYALTCV